MSDETFDVIDKLELPGDGELPEAVAQFLLGIRFSAAEQARYSELASRHNNEGLSPDELKALSAFVDVDGLLAILQAQARQVLSKHQPAA
jgi:hypothetical protein